MTAAVARPELAPAYEALRAHATGQCPTIAPRGLAVLLRGGVPAWITAWEPVAVQSPTPGATYTALPLGGRAEELVSMLTEMALGSLRRSIP